MRADSMPVRSAQAWLRAADCTTRVRLQVDYSRCSLPQLVFAPRLAEAHFHGKPEQ